MEPSKKRTFSGRQLESVLDGGYWSTTSSSRTKKPTPSSPSFTNTNKSPKPKKSTTTNSPLNEFSPQVITLTKQEIPPPTTAYQPSHFSTTTTSHQPSHFSTTTTPHEALHFSTTSHQVPHFFTTSHQSPQFSTMSHQASHFPTTSHQPPHFSTTSHETSRFSTTSHNPSQFSTTTTTIRNHSYDVPLSFSTSHPPPPSLPSSSHSPIPPPPPPLPSHLHKTKTDKKTDRKPETKAALKPEIKTEIKTEITETQKAGKNANVELDGSYWATFDAGTKRKKERVLADLTTVDSGYWNKRNARAQVPKKPAQPLTDEQRAKRAEKLARTRDAHEAEQQEAHERILRKQEEARMGKEVFPGVFLGSKHAAKNWEFFEKHKICGVVNVTSEVPNYHQDKGSVTYMKIPVSDLPTVDLLETFEKIAGSIHELTQKGNILIHCKEGKSRSPTFCMAFAMKYLAMQLVDAHQSIVNKSEIRVNLGFQQQLMSYERRVFNVEYNSFNFLQKRKPT